jgi:hypothetical protein
MMQAANLWNGHDRPRVGDEIGPVAASPWRDIPQTIIVPRPAG